MQLPDLARHDTTAKLVLHNAAHWGGDVALREKEYGIWKVYTWADTRARVEELARGLLGVGIARGYVVGIIGRNRPHWLWAELAAHAVVSRASASHNAIRLLTVLNRNQPLLWQKARAVSLCLIL